MTRANTLAEDVADSLREQLKTGIYRCGERLAEITIARELNVSQNTVRDALNTLEQEGWVIKRARKGVSVVQFTLLEAEELFTLWATLEALALDWMFEAITTPDQMQLAHFISDARLYAGTGNRRALTESLHAFHATIAHIADRPQTSYLLKRIHNQARLLDNMRVIPYTSSMYLEILTQYGELITYIRREDQSKARITLQDIIMGYFQRLQPIIEF